MFAQTGPVNTPVPSPPWGLMTSPNLISHQLWSRPRFWPSRCVAWSPWVWGTWLYRIFFWGGEVRDLGRMGWGRNEEPRCVVSHVFKWNGTSRRVFFFWYWLEPDGTFIQTFFLKVTEVLKHTNQKSFLICLFSICLTVFLYIYNWF